MNRVRCKVTTLRIKSCMSQLFEPNNCPLTTERRTELIVRTNLINLLNSVSVAQRLHAGTHAFAAAGGHQLSSPTQLCCQSPRNLLGSSQGWLFSTR